MSDERKILVHRLQKALDLGDEKSVRQAFLKAFDILPNDLLLQAKWAEYLLGIAAPEALEVSVRAYRRAAARPDIQLALCCQMFHSGYKKKAHELLPRRNKGESINHLFFRLDMASDRQDTQKARELCNLILLSAELTEAQLVTLAKKGKQIQLSDVVLAVYQRLAGRPKASPLDHARLLAAYMNEHAEDAAYHHLSRLPKEMIKHPAIVDQRAKLCLLRGENDTAYKLLLALLELTPENPDVWVALSELAPVGELDGCIKQCEQSLHKQTNPKARTIMLFALGAMYERLAVCDKAFDCYRRGNDRLKASYVEDGRSYRAKEQEVLHDRICDFFPADLFDAHSDTARPLEPFTPTPIFIVGMPRSGTSLLERVLASLDGVAAGGENPGLGKIAYEHLQQLQRRQGVLPVNISTAIWQKMRNRYASDLKTTARFITDKLPQNYRNLGWALQMFPDARIIYLRREPCDLAWSIYKRAFRPTFSYSADLRDLAHAIMMCERYMRHWVTVAPYRILTVSYEKLVQTPDTVSKEVADHCGLVWDNSCLSPETLDIPCHTLSKVQVRQPISSIGIGQWRAYETYLHPFIEQMELYGLKR